MQFVTSDLDSVCLELLRDSGTPAPLRRFAEETRGVLARVPVVGLVGRVNSGKSTLVNALLGRRVAPTATQDCTRLVTCYRFGAPESVTAVLLDGSRRPIAPDLTQVTPDPQISHLDVALQTEALRTLTIIDTPGVQGTELDAGPLVRRSLAGADVIVHLFRDGVRNDDAVLAAEFAGSTDGAGFDRSRVVGVLAHADNYGAGPAGEVDPIEAARAEAVSLSARHRRHFSAVVPVSALLAETTATGQLTEADTRVVQAAAALDPDLLPFFGHPGVGDVDPGRAHAVLAKVGAYGVIRGSRHATSSATLIADLAERAGLDELRVVLHGTLFGLARTRRVVDAVRRLEALSATTPLPPRTGALLSHALRGPIGHLAVELATYEDLVAGHPRSALVRDFELLLGNVTRGERLLALGARWGGDPSTGRLAEEARRYQGVASMTTRGVEAQSARVLSMSMHYLGQGG